MARRLSPGWPLPPALMSMPRSGPTPPVAPPHGGANNSRCGLDAASTPTLSLPPWMSASLSPCQRPPGPDRGDTRGGLDSHSQDGWRRCRRDDLHPSRPSRTPRRCGSLSGGSDARFPARPRYSYHAHHRPRWGDAGTGGRSSPPRRGRGHTRRFCRRRASPPTAPGWRSR